MTRQMDIAMGGPGTSPEQVTAEATEAEVAAFRASLSARKSSNWSLLTWVG